MQGGIASKRVKGLAKAVEGQIAAWLGRRRRPAILLYHRIAGETFDPWGLSVSPQRFAQQLDWIARYRSVLRLGEFAHLHSLGRLPADAVALTFDDGYACVAEVAAPLLESMGMPATIFLPAEVIEEGRPFWWDELAGMVLSTSAPVLHADGLTIELGSPAPNDGRWAPGDSPSTARQRAFFSLWERLRTMAPAALADAMTRLRSEAGLAAELPVHDGPMTRQQLHSLGSTVEFGSHALSHPSLPSLPRAEKEREISESVQRCEELIGVKPTAFAYPYGDRDPESEDLVQRAGFSCACTTRHAFVDDRTGAFALPRIQVGNWSAARLARVLAAR